MIGRRHSVLGLCLVAAGCGFHSLYGSAGIGRTRLATVYVDIIPNRNGQLLRQALQARLEGASEGVAKRFALDVSYSESVGGLGVRSDNATTRNRDIGTAVWSLHPVGNGTVQIAGGTVRSVDGYNIIDEQFFYADLSEEATQRRLATALADQIMTALAVFFDGHKELG